MVGVVAHLVERSIRIAEVVGSSPIYSTIRIMARTLLNIAKGGVWLKNQKLNYEAKPKLLVL